MASEGESLPTTAEAGISAAAGDVDRRGLERRSLRAKRKKWDLGVRKPKTAKRCRHGRIRNQCKDCGGSRICRHGKYKSYCKECGGSQICEHGRIKSFCQNCGGSQICSHGRVKYGCKECRRLTSLCPHQELLMNCTECLNRSQEGQQNPTASSAKVAKRTASNKSQARGDAQPALAQGDQKRKAVRSNPQKRCEHGRIKSQCKECGGTQICPHGKYKSYCRACGGSQICAHGKIKSYCGECGGSQVCAHEKKRRKCIICCGSGMCRHRKRKDRCDQCSLFLPCPHGSVIKNCTVCTLIKSSGGENPELPTEKSIIIVERESCEFEICKHDLRVEDCPECRQSAPQSGLDVELQPETCRHGVQRKDCGACCSARMLDDFALVAPPSNGSNGAGAGSLVLHLVVDENNTAPLLSLGEGLAANKTAMPKPEMPGNYRVLGTRRMQAACSQTPTVLINTESTTLCSGRTSDDDREKAVEAHDVQEISRNARGRQSFPDADTSSSAAGFENSRDASRLPSTDENGRARDRCQSSKSYCKECGGSQNCQDGRINTFCRRCGGSEICEQDRVKFLLQGRKETDAAALKQQTVEVAAKSAQEIGSTSSPPPSVQQADQAMLPQPASQSAETAVTNLSPQAPPQLQHLSLQRASPVPGCQIGDNAFYVHLQARAPVANTEGAAQPSAPTPESIALAQQPTASVAPGCTIPTPWNRLGDSFQGQAQLPMPNFTAVGLGAGVGVPAAAFQGQSAVAASVQSAPMQPVAATVAALTPGFGLGLGTALPVTMGLGPQTGQVGTPNTGVSGQLFAAQHLMSQSLRAVGVAMPLHLQQAFNSPGARPAGVAVPGGGEEVMIDLVTEDEDEPGPATGSSQPERSGQSAHAADSSSVGDGREGWGQGLPQEEVDEETANGRESSGPMGSLAAERASAADGARKQPGRPRGDGKGKTSSKRCVHGRIKHQCKECRGSSICGHGNYRSYCKECGGSQICEHRKIRRFCRECKALGREPCAHGRRRDACEECRPDRRTTVFKALAARGKNLKGAGGAQDGEARDGDHSDAPRRECADQGASAEARAVGGGGGAEANRDRGERREEGGGEPGESWAEPGEGRPTQQAQATEARAGEAVVAGGGHHGETEGEDVDARYLGPKRQAGAGAGTCPHGLQQGVCFGCSAEAACMHGKPSAACLRCFRALPCRHRVPLHACLACRPPYLHRDGSLGQPPSLCPHSRVPCCCVQCYPERLSLFCSARAPEAQSRATFAARPRTGDASPRQTAPRADGSPRADSAGAAEEAREGEWTEEGGRGFALQEARGGRGGRHGAPARRGAPRGLMGCGFELDHATQEEPAGSPSPPPRGATVDHAGGVSESRGGGGSLAAAARAALPQAGAGFGPGGGGGAAPRRSDQRETAAASGAGFGFGGGGGAAGSQGRGQDGSQAGPASGGGVGAYAPGGALQGHAHGQALAAGSAGAGQAQSALVQGPPLLMPQSAALPAPPPGAAQGPPPGRYLRQPQQAVLVQGHGQHGFAPGQPMAPPHSQPQYHTYPQGYGYPPGVGPAMVQHLMSHGMGPPARYPTA